MYSYWWKRLFLEKITRIIKTCKFNGCSELTNQDKQSLTLTYELQN